MRSMIPRVVVVAVALLLSLLPSSVAASEYSLTLDPASTDVTFTLQATGEDVQGTLYLRNADIRFDPETGQAAGRIEIDATRTETGNSKRDKKMHAKVLETESNPLILFVPRAIQGEYRTTGSSEVTLLGTLTLLGMDHEVALPATVSVEGSTIGFDSHFTVPYVDWGLHDPSWLVLKVAREVEVTVQAHDVAVSSVEQARAAGSE